MPFSYSPSVILDKPLFVHPSHSEGKGLAEFQRKTKGKEGEKREREERPHQERAAKPAWTKFDYYLTLVKNEHTFLRSPRIHSGSWRSELFTHCLLSLQRMELSWIFGQKKKKIIHKQGHNQAESLVKKFCSCPRSDERSLKDLEKGCIIRLGFQSLTE